MAIVSKLLVGCFLEGESYISVIYNDVTLNISHFELRGDTSATLNIYIYEPSIDEEIIITPPSNLGGNVISIAPVQQWKMVEEEDGRARTPPHLKFRAEWRL